MVEDAFIIRPAHLDDAGFLFEMLIEAVNWCPSRDRLAREAVRTRPDLVHYTQGWPRKSDQGVIAQAAGTPIGAAWCRHFSEEDPGYGFVAPGIPELTIGVVRAWRGQGVGRAMLRALVSIARDSGLAALSLSVERANKAQHLYCSEGFRVVASGRDSDTMVRNLA